LLLSIKKNIISEDILVSNSSGLDLIRKSVRIRYSPHYCDTDENAITTGLIAGKGISRMKLVRRLAKIYKYEDVLGRETLLIIKSPCYYGFFIVTILPVYDGFFIFKEEFWKK
jgi:hypothetical protein